MKDIYIDYTKPVSRGGNCTTKKDLNAIIKELKKEGWTVEFGKYGIGENEYFKYWYEAIKYEEIKEGECLRCKSKNIIDIVYGYPTAKAIKEAEQGKIYLGGCCIDENNPIYFCRDCKNKFGKRSVA